MRKFYFLFIGLMTGWNQTAIAADILQGRYWIGHTGQALEIQGDHYRYEHEGGAEPWRSISELQPVKKAVVFDGQNYWCLSSMAFKTQVGSCTEKGWITSSLPQRKLLFSCLTASNKQILLHDAGRTIDYTFGHLNQPPELSLKVLRNQAATWQWSGIGQHVYYQIDVPNADVTYTVFWDASRYDPSSIRAGVNVIKKQRVIATVNCASSIVNQMQNVDLKERELE